MFVLAGPFPAKILSSYSDLTGEAQNLAPLLHYLWIFIIPDVCSATLGPYHKAKLWTFYLYEEHLTDCCPCGAGVQHRLLKVTAQCLSPLGHSFGLNLRKIHHFFFFFFLFIFFFFFLFSQRGSLCYSILIPGGQIQQFCLMLLAFQRSFVLCHHCLASSAAAVLDQDWTPRNNCHLLRS